jgi:hypothetical protein
MLPTTILSLLYSCSPTAIGWFVVAVIVDTLNRHAGRTATHVGKKQPVIMPVGTNGNTSCAIVTKSCVSWVLTSLNHRAPSAVFATADISMLFEPNHSVCFKTSAALASSLAQARSIIGFYFSAIALAQYARHPNAIWLLMSASLSQDCQSREAFSNHRISNCGLSRHLES